MMQEDKQLLVKVLCALSPYGIKILYDGKVHEIQYVEPLYNEVKLLDPSLGYTVGIEDVKPYLRPMESMTSAEVLEYLSLKEDIVADDGITYSFETYESIDWLNAHYFDYRGLIEKNLALDCTGLHIYD